MSRKLNRYSAHRLSMFRNLAVSLATYGSIETTLPKAKDLRVYFEPLVTRAKVNDLNSRRYLLSKMHNNNDAVSKLFERAVAHKDRAGGYLRIFKLEGGRAIIQFVDHGSI